MKEGVFMNELLERYLGAVCSYFIGPKKEYVYHDLKNQLKTSAKHYDDLEALLIQYGHPRSVALSYGYRPFFNHIFNSKVVNKIEKYIFAFSFIYLFFSTLYYLYQLNCLPFQTTHQVTSSLNTSTSILWILSHPIIVSLFIVVFSLFSLYMLEMKFPEKQDYDLTWNVKTLNDLPHVSHYPSHIIESTFMIVFMIYFALYALFFNSDTIIRIQHSSYQMIHLMTYFFQPFIMIIIFDYFIDMTKKTYTKKYLKYSTFINIFTITSLTFFVINSNYLNNYLLPFDINFQYILVNVFILGALFMIYFISVYKFLRNIKYYRALYKK